MTGALPHRYPFLMVDRVVEVEPGVRAVAVKTVTAVGHHQQGLPGLAFPEVMVLEAMAQVGALTAAGAAPMPDAPAGETAISGYLAALTDVKFHVRPVPGDVVVMTLEFVARIGPLVRFRGTAAIDGETAVEAGLSFTVDMR